MKILYAVHQFYPETSGGTEHFLLNLSHGMQRAGHRAEIVAYSLLGGAEFQRSGSLLQHEYVYNRLPVMAFRHAKLPLELNTEVTDPVVMSFARSFARQFLSARKYDLVHLIHPMRVSPFALAAAEMAIPFVVTLTDFWTICPKITLQTSYRKLCGGPDGGRACAQLCPELSSAWVQSRLAATHRLLSDAVAVVAPSAFAASLIQSQFPDVDIQVVPHGLPRNLPTNSKRYVSGSRIVFGYCGGLAPHKGVHVLLDAFRNLHSDKVSLKIFGVAGPMDSAYERELRHKAAGDHRITFQGAYRADEVGTVLQSVDVLVVPSLWYETYSLSLHEAFACTVPVIASKIGVLSEAVKEGENGLTFPLGDEQSLAEQLRRVAECPTELNAFKENLAAFALPFEEEESYRYDRLYTESLSRISGPAATNM